MPTKEIVKVGEAVLAKWPGSSLYYDATVISIEKNEVTVRFSEGTEETLASKFVASNQPKKSRGRAKSPSRARSRSTDRSKSPSRKSAKKTPMKSPKTTRRARSSSRSRRLETRDQSKSPSPVRTKKAAVSQSNSKQSKSVEKIANSSEVSTMSRRSSSRIAAMNNNKIVEEKLEPIKKDVTDSKEKPEILDDKKRYGFFSHLAMSIMIFGLPAICYLYYLACTKLHCSVTSLPPKIPNSVSRYISLETFGLYCSWVFGLFLLSLIPIGKVQSSVHRGHSALYRFNGFYSCLVVFATVCGLQYFGYSSSFVYKRFFKFMTSSMIFAFVFSLLVYIKSFWTAKRYLNRTGNTGCWPTDFFIGREADPRFGQCLDIKLFMFRCGVITWMVLLLSIVSQEYNLHKQAMNPSLVLSAALQLVYLIEILYNEDGLASTASIKEPFGYLLCFISTTALPFLSVLPVRYMLIYRPVIPYWILIVVAFVFFVGLFIMIQSNVQKHRFRTNPYDPRVSHLETIPTDQGKKLLVSGWWGWICHPNYVGDILCCLAFSIPAGSQHALPYLLPLQTLIMLLFQARNDDIACRKKYGSAWDQYRERVKYRLIPYIY